MTLASSKSAPRPPPQPLAVTEWGCITSHGRSTPSNDLREIEGRLRTLGALVGASDHGTTKALYGQDPDGLEFEVCWLVPADLMTDDAQEARSRIGPLDIDAEIARYGATTPSGVGISRIAPSPA